MPRTQRQLQPMSIVAAAKSYMGGSKGKENRKPRTAEQWQRHAWDYFDTIPEYHQACTVVGALLSRSRLVVQERQTDGSWMPAQNNKAVAALNDLYGGEDGQVQMLRLLGIHFTVAGGAYIMGPSKRDLEKGRNKWRVVASTSITKINNEYRINGDPAEGRSLFEIWKPHPADDRKYDSPTRAILPVLAELSQLSKRVSAQIDSRLHGAGILFVPSETAIPDAASGDAQGLADLLFENAQNAISDQQSAAAMIPIIAETPGEYIKDVKHVSFTSDLDKSAPALREESIRRIALGMDMPPEILLGGSQSNHWNAWLSDENSVKLHAEPLLAVITSSLTAAYLHRVLEGEVDDVWKYRIYADTSKMRLRPNRSKEALELNRSLLLSDEAALRENGFDPADAMDDEGVRRALIRTVAGGSTTPELVAEALRALGVDIAEITDHRDPAEARPKPSLKDHPVRELPEQKDQAHNLTALVFAAEQMVDRALQRAGNRLKTKFAVRNSEIPANRLYLQFDLRQKDVQDVLQDAWSTVADFDYGVNPEVLTSALDAYTRSILLTKAEPSRATLRSVLFVALKANQGAK